MNKLPKVYANPINHNINNDQKSYTSHRSNHRSSSVTITDIDRILNNIRRIKPSKVQLNINGDICEKVLVARKNDYIITIDNEKININDILSIKEI